RPGAAPASGEPRRPCPPTAQPPHGRARPTAASPPPRSAGRRTVRPAPPAWHREPEASAETDRRHYESVSPPRQATPEAKAPTPQQAPATPTRQKPEKRETSSRQHQPEPAKTETQRRQ